MKILITGAAGFIGAYLTRLSRESGSTTFGIDINEPKEDLTGVPFELCDIRDFERLKGIIKKVRPDRVFHLASQSFPTVSMVQPRETMEVNAGGTINLFESLRELKLSPVVIVACSSAEYGPAAEEELPVREDHALRPLHPYGASKVAEDLLSAQYGDNYSIPVIRLRIFKTSGPGKVGDVCSDFARRAIEIEMKLRPAILEVGNLYTRRSIVDVRDLVEALWLSADCCEPGEVYNVGNEAVYSMRDLLDEIRSLTGLRFEVQQRLDLVRSSDEPIVVGENLKVRSRTGWMPTIGIRTTLLDTLNWWRERLGARTPARF